MAGTISFQGIGSGMDVSGIIDALVNVAQVPVNNLSARATATRAAESSVSDIASALSQLQTAADALSDASHIQGYAVSSASSAVSASVTGAAAAGSYDVKVESLAKEYRAYSGTYDSLVTSLGLDGNMILQIGDGDPTIVNIAGTDSLTNIITKINESGARIQATTFYDGSQYRLQLRGLDTGADAAVTVSGIDLGLNDEGAVKQQAQDAHLVVDGIDVYSSSNQVAGTIPGVTLTAVSTMTDAAPVSVTQDASTVITKLQTFISAYNSVISKIQTVAGYGETKATSDILAGDSTLRQVTSRMGNTVMSIIDTGSAYSTLYSIGVSLDKTGKLVLDQDKLTTAMNADAESVNRVLAGTTNGDGVMDLLSDVVDLFTDGIDGLLSNKVTSLENQAKRLDTQVDEQQDRLDKYREQLEEQFSAMDTAVSSSYATMDYLTQLYGSSS